MNLLHKFLNRTDFTDYDDFVKNVEFSVPENFNFGFDVVDEYARLAPEKRALVWCNAAGDEKIMTFGDISRASNRAVNFLISAGVKKGESPAASWARSSSPPLTCSPPRTSSTAAIRRA